MDRRTFLRTGLSLLPVVALAPLAGACAARPRASTPAPQPVTAPVAAPVAAPIVVPPSTPISVPGPLLEELARLTGGREVSDDLDSWLASLDQARQDRVRETNAKMAENGFSDYRGLKIFAKDDIFFYNVANVDRVNACTPFWVAGERGALAEGPVVTGMTLAARDWPEAGSAAVARGLIPIGTIQPEPGTSFESTMRGAYLYRTATGTLRVFYRADSAARTGLISITAKDSTDALLLGKDYAIRWG